MPKRKKQTTTSLSLFSSSSNSSDDENGSVRASSSQARKALFRGQNWTEQLCDMVDWDKIRENKAFIEYQSRCPFVPGDSIRRRVYDLLSTQDVGVVTSFYGLRDAPLDDERLKRSVLINTDFVLKRGNVGGLPTDRWNTNSNYLPRIMEFLEYMEDHQDLGTSFKDIQMMTNMTVNQLKNHCWEFSGVIYLTTERAVISYFEHKASITSTPLELHDDDEEEKEDEDNDGWMHINLDILAKRVKVDAVENPQRIKRPQRKGLGVNECKCIKNALEELNRIQLTFLGISNFLRPFNKSVNYLSWFNTFNRQVREREKFELTDKSHKSLINQPTKRQIEGMLTIWVALGCKRGSLNDAYRGLVHRTLWLISCQMGLMRMDNTYKILYSDLEYMNFSEHGDIQTPTTFEVFLVKQQQSKTNRDGAIQYACCCPHMEEWNDAMGSLAMTLALKHDLLLLDPPDLKDLLRSKQDPNESFRPWSMDYIFSSISTNKRNDPFAYLGQEFPSVDNSMKWPFSLQSISSTFEKAMVDVGIDNQHILHLPRVFGVFQNGINGVTTLETKATGHWQDKGTGTFESTYQLIPMMDTIVKMGGASSISDYTPFWSCIDPPPSLTQHVLSSFNDVLFHSNERVQLSKRLQSKHHKKWLYDRQAIFLQQFIDRMKKLFVQIAPELKKRHKDHVLVRHHKLFQDPSFETYVKFSTNLKSILHTLNTLMPPLFTNTRKLRFFWDFHDVGNMALRHTSSSESTQPMMNMLCDRITTALLSIEGNDGQVSDSMLSDIIRCASSNNVAYEMATWKQFTQKMLLEAACSKCHSEAACSKHHHEIYDEVHDENPNGIDNKEETDPVIVNEAKEEPIFPHLTLPLGPNRIEKCWEIWMENSPTLKSAFTEKNEKNAFGSRKEGSRARQAARYIRLTCVALELLEGEISLATVQRAVVRKKMYISRLGKELAKIFGDMKVTSGKCLLSESIKANENYEKHGGTAYFGARVRNLLDLDV